MLIEEIHMFEISSKSATDIPEISHMKLLDFMKKFDVRLLIIPEENTTNCQNFSLSSHFSQSQLYFKNAINYYDKIHACELSFIDVEKFFEKQSNGT
jgi:hypothetical protein